ncbi:unnamed protein product, partial [Ixodes pacificus]
RCGVCECHPRENREETVTGKYCECDNFSCDRVDGELCGGEEKGSCICGKCECRNGWTGPNCNCLDTNDTCIGPNGKICSGFGECFCGQCKCHETDEERYSGLYCEDCPVSVRGCSRGGCKLPSECVHRCVLCSVLGNWHRMLLRQTF